MNIVNDKAPAHMQYKEKKPLFSEKEIIFRSSGCAKVWQISSRAQVVFLAVLLLIGITFTTAPVTSFPTKTANWTKRVTPTSN